MNIESIAAALLFIISIMSAIYGMMKFMLRDITAAVSLMDKHVNELRSDIKEANKRMDGVYHILLKRIKE